MLGSSSSAKIHCPRSKPPEQAVCAQEPRDTSPSKQSLQNTKKNPKFPITPGNKSIHNNFTSQWHLRTSASYYRASWFFKKHHSSATYAVDPLEFHFKASIPSRWTFSERGGAAWPDPSQAGHSPGDNGDRGRTKCQLLSWLLPWGTAVQGPGHKGEREELPKNQPAAVIGHC